MKTIEMSTWNRRAQFEFFATYDDPCFIVQVNVDVTALRAACEDGQRSFFYATLFGVLQAVNDVPEMRLRIRGRDVVQHERVGTSFTTRGVGDQLAICRVPYHADYGDFVAACRAQADRARSADGLEPDPPRDDLVFTTCIPWYSFTALRPPIQGAATRSIPEIDWGRDFEQGGRRLIPVVLRAHHGLLDGLHGARFFDALHRRLDALAHAPAAPRHPAHDPLSLRAPPHRDTAEPSA